MKQYLDLLRDIKENGELQENRTGTNTIAVFGREIRFNMSDGFPILTTKKIHIKSVLYELFWILGNHMKDDKYKNLPITNIKYLNDNGVTIWNEWADKDGNLGPVYGHQWIHWDTNKQISIRDGSYPNGEFKWRFEYQGINQISELINKLKNNPNSRRLLVSAWNVGELDKMNLPPCHYGFECFSIEMNKAERYTRWLAYRKNHKVEDTGMSAEGAMDYYNFPKRKLSLKWNQRSIDTFLGLPFHITSYAFLLHMLAMVTNHIPNELIGHLGNTHLYVNHMKYVDEQLQRIPKQLPVLKIKREVTDINDFKFEDFELVNYVSDLNWKNVPIAV